MSTRSTSAFKASAAPAFWIASTTIRRPLEPEPHGRRLVGGEKLEDNVDPGQLARARIMAK